MCRNGANGNDIFSPCEHETSVWLLQRWPGLGYGRAARIMDELENRGIVGPSKGAEPRDILIDLDEVNPDENQQA